MIGQDIGPFLLEGNDIGCLLIHSFANTPHEMQGFQGKTAYPGPWPKSYQDGLAGTGTGDRL